MDLELSARERELAGRGRDFFEQVLAPLEPVVESHGELPPDRREAVRQAVRDWGLAGINHSKEDGGLGLTMLEQTVIEEQLGRATNGLWTCVWRRPYRCASELQPRSATTLCPATPGSVEAPSR